ncbi:heavy metal-associated isoprenylated plant protein 39-like [Wolffia australiana]
MSEKKIVVRVDVDDEKGKQKAIMAVAVLSGVSSISMAMKDKKMTVTGVVDPVRVVDKLKKHWHVEIVHIGPKEGKEITVKKPEEPAKEPVNINPPYNPHWTSVEEDPNSCVIF